MKAVRSLFGERPVLKLIYSALIRASENWRGMRVSELERAQLQQLGQQLTERHLKENSAAVKPGSTRKEIYSKDRT